MSSSKRTGLAIWIGLIALELNIGIHVALTPMHLDEKFYIGVLFSIGNGVLFAAMLLLISRRLRIFGWLLGAATSVAEFGGFIASRTTGLPLGYKETWASAPEDLLGLTCLFAEVVFVAAAVCAVATVSANSEHLDPAANIAARGGESRDSVHRNGSARRPALQPISQSRHERAS